MRSYLVRAASRRVNLLGLKLGQDTTSNSRSVYSSPITYGRVSDVESALKRFDILGTSKLEKVSKRLKELENQNAFKVFDMEERMDINTDRLKSEMRQLQRILHPDKFVGEDINTQGTIGFLSTLVNEYYNMLRNPYERGKYLLSLRMNKSSQEIERKLDGVKVEQEFLMEMLETQEMVQTKRADIGVLRKLHGDLQFRLDQLTLELMEQFKKGDEEQILNSLARMKFLANCYLTVEDGVGNFGDF